MALLAPGRLRRYTPASNCDRYWTDLAPRGEVPPSSHLRRLAGRRRVEGQGAAEEIAGGACLRKGAGSDGAKGLKAKGTQRIR